MLGGGRKGGEKREEEEECAAVNVSLKLFWHEETGELFLRFSTVTHQCQASFGSFGKFDNWKLKNLSDQRFSPIGTRKEQKKKKLFSKNWRKQFSVEMKRWEWERTNVCIITLCNNCTCKWTTHRQTYKHWPFINIVDNFMSHQQYRQLVSVFIKGTMRFCSMLVIVAVVGTNWSSFKVQNGS